MGSRKQTGFTLVEMMVSLSVFIILAGIAVPSFQGAMKNSRLAADVNALSRALYHARSEAIKTRDSISVCAGDYRSQQCGSGWQEGWVVFIDRQPLSEPGASAVGAEDTVIGVYEEPRSAAEITLHGSTNGTASGIQAATLVRYNARGKTNWANASVTFCDDRGAEYSKVINITYTGDIQRGNASADSEIPLDIFGRSICS